MVAGDGDKKTADKKPADKKTGGNKAKSAHHDDASDAALWGRITETIKPLRSRRRPPSPTEPATTAPPAEKSHKHRPPGPPPASPPAKPHLPELSTAVAHGVDKRTAQRLGRGQLEIEARLDLHGLTQDEAHARLSGFIRRSAAAGKRCVLVITGKGYKPPYNNRGGGTGVLRQAVPRWLNEPALRHAIVALRHAQPKDGGEGALYVLLKRDRGAAPIGKDAPPPKRLARQRRDP